MKLPSARSMDWDESPHNSFHLVIERFDDVHILLELIIDQSGSSLFLIVYMEDLSKVEKKVAPLPSPVSTTRPKAKTVHGVS